MSLRFNLVTLLLLLHVCVCGQGYVRMYSDTRGVSDYADYQEIIIKYNKGRDYASTVASLDSVAAVFLNQGQPGAYLFHINDAANILLTKGKKQQALNFLSRGMEQFSQNSTEMHWEYVCSLILMGYIPNNGHDRLDLLSRQIDLMDSMKVDNQAYLHAVMNKGRLLMNRNRVKEGLAFCQKARTIARERGDVYSVAIIDFWSLLKFRSKSKSETITELIQLKIDELKPYDNHAAIHFYTTLYTYLLAEIYYTDLEQFDSASVALERAREEILKNPERFFRLSAVCDAMACALEAKADVRDILLCDSLASEVFRKSEKRPIKYTDRADAWQFLLDSRALSDKKLQILSGQISDQLNQGKDDVLEFLNLKTQVLTQLGSCDSILPIVRKVIPRHGKSNYFLNRIDPEASFLEQGRLYATLGQIYNKHALEGGEESDFQNFYNALHLADSAYRLYGAAHYAGVEYSVFAKEYQQFSDSAIQWLSAAPHNKSDLLVRFMLSTKTLGMSNYLKKMRRQVAFESDSLLYDDWKKRQRALLVLRNRLKEETEPDSVRQIQHRLADLLYIELNSMYVSDWEVDAGLTEVPSAENIQRILDDNACLLNYRLVGEQVFVLAITHDKITLHREHLPAQLIKKNRYLLKTGGRMQPQFTELLLGGLDELLTGKDHLVIIPDQELLLLPFEALPWKGEYLLAHYAVSYQYSVDLWLNSVLKDREELPWRMLSVAPGFLSEQEWQGYISQRGGTDNMALAPLRYSLEEVDEVEALNRKAHKEYKVLRGNEANEEQVKRIFADYSVLHFATHGYVNKKYPELSGLYLYASEDEINKRDDDFLSLGEIYLHDLQANLAILSACKTGMGKIQPGEGITALPRGFMLAGVPNVVATLWNVDDRVSKNLMIAFYKNVLQSGDGYAKALQKAKLQMVDKGVLPVDWSGFILIGK